MTTQQIIDAAEDIDPIDLEGAIDFDDDVTCIDFTDALDFDYCD